MRCNIPTCDQEFDTIFAYENHYNSLHRFLCAQCSKNLPSAHLLDLHLSERHDSFFAVQSERKPMVSACFPNEIVLDCEHSHGFTKIVLQYRCYLEECPTLHQTPTERRDHCISEHKFPPDFRFDCYKHTKRNAANHKVDGQTNNAKATNSNADKTSVLKPSKLVSVTTHDEDIELEDKSILLTAQRKHLTNFSFGHKKTKTFRSNASSSQSGSGSYAKQLTAKSEIKHNKPKSGLTDANMVDELMDSLPQ